MPNRAAELMRMMQGTMGGGGANLPSNNVVGSPFRSRPNLGGPAPSQIDPRAIEQSMQETMGPGGGAGYDDIIEKLMEVMRRRNAPQMAPSNVQNMMMNTMGGMRKPAPDILPPPGWGGGPTPGPDSSPMYHGQPRRPPRMDMGRFRR